MKKLSGRCLCTAIAYEISGEPGPIFNCHCSKCRRWHGAAFRTRAKAPWYTLCDGLPQYPAWPGSEEKVRETRE